MSGDEPKKTRKKNRRPADESEPGVTDEGSAPTYFLIICNEGKDRRLYRGYPDLDGISFISAGPWLWFLDPEVGREVSKAGWITRTLDSLKAVHIAVGGIVILVAALLFKLVIGASDIVDILLFLLGFGVVAAVCTLLLIGKTVHSITKRVAALDTLSRTEIQSEASDGEGSFRALANTVSNVRIEPDDEALQGEGSTSAVLFFRHSTGKWRLILPTRQDTKAAARAFRRILGEDEVQVNVPLNNT